MAKINNLFWPKESIPFGDLWKMEIVFVKSEKVFKIFLPRGARSSAPQFRSHPVRPEKNCQMSIKVAQK